MSPWITCFNKDFAFYILMFNTITNVKNRTVLGNISLEELINDLRNPSTIQKIAVDKARTLDKKSKAYLDIKKSLPCFVPNYLHKNYVKVDTIEKSTGFIYIDVDYELDINFSDFSFIAASWKSLSGVGSGLLIALADYENLGTDLKTMRSIINDICEVLDIKPDSCAVSRDRLNVIAYDLNAYYNSKYTRFSVSKILNNINNKVDKKENNIYLNWLETDVHFYEGDLRLSNLDQLKENLHFEDDQLYLDLSDNPIQYTNVFIPKSISVGERNATIFRILSTVKALNPLVKPERFIGFANHINNTRCFDPMDEEELNGICNRLINKKIKLYPNKSQKYPINPIYKLTGKERSAVASSAHNKKIGNKTTENILNAVKTWDVGKDGKLSLKSISKKLNISYKTVLRRKKDIENLDN